jgi:NADH:ubiquinone oxidoreductase subunit F (NADH-binding)
MPTGPASAAIDPSVIGIAPALELLHGHQARRGYLAEEDLAAVAAAIGLSVTELYGAVTAYPRFRLAPGEPQAFVCTAPVCRLHGARAVADRLGVTAEPHCLGLCDQPVALWTPDGPRIAPVGSQLGQRPPGDPGALAPPVAPPPVIGLPESAFFGPDDPFEAVATAQRLAADALIRLITASGLQGRGGAGFAAGRKWAAVRAALGEPKVVICNADESEPGTFKDRAVLDHAPRRLLAGLAIAARAVGATRGIIYLRDEYRPQHDRLAAEIDRLRGAGLLGEGFDVVLRRGAGLYICGEETALLNSLEGRRPIPRDRPPYPPTHGLSGAPTLVQNAETLAALPAIVGRGADWFRSAGQPKLYCVSGDAPAPGVFELPLGTPAGALVERAGADVGAVKAFTLGGISGGLLPAGLLDLALDFDAPRRHGAYLGSGGLIVADRSRCMVRFALDALRFYAAESCGKCFPCRIGTTRLRERLEELHGFRTVDTTELAELEAILLTGSACGLGPSAALIVQHLQHHFPDDLQAHAVEGRCPTGECDREVHA